jgi:hypothetical protein
MTAYQLPERAEVTFVATRHETGDELEALSEGCRVAVAEELRRIAVERDGVGLCFPSYSQHILMARADELDPEGATR